MLLSRLRSVQLDSLFENAMKSNSYVHPQASQFCLTHSPFLSCSCSCASLRSCNAHLAQLFMSIATYHGQKYKLIDHFDLSTSSFCTACITPEAEKYLENLMPAITCFLHSPVLCYSIDLSLCPEPPAPSSPELRSCCIPH